MSCFLLPLALCRLLDRHLARFWWGVNQGERRIHWVSWKSLCLSKHEGSLGFRRFEEFNQALLAKVAWRIWKEPNSLLARVFKGKYFPNSSILVAKAGSLPSWGWRGVLHGRDLLVQGLRWQVGSGESIDVLTDNWVPTLHPSPPTPRPGIVRVEGSVASLICPNQGVWRVDCLRQIFEEDTVRAIVAIPLPISSVPDRMVWNGEQSGRYTVKSGYHLAVELRRYKELRVKAKVQVWDRSLWKTVWGAPVPPKLRYFIWQMVRVVLPTGEALSSRGVGGLEPCPVCGEEGESLEHLFFRCRVAVELWEGAELLAIRDRFPLCNVGIFWRRLLEWRELDQGVMMHIVALFWRIWKARNWVVFELTQYIVPLLLSQFRLQVAEWDGILTGRGVSHYSGVSGARGRQDVPMGEFVMFVDGATSPGSHGAGGWALQDPTGMVVAASAALYVGIWEPALVELLAFPDALRWCLAFGFQSMVFAGDAQVVVGKIRDGEVDDVHGGMLLEEIRSMRDLFQEFRVIFVGRESNRVAHLVARKALSLSPSLVGFNFVSWLFSAM
ncbi:unnamed protein product [Linum trigynum]|uniref:Reverse transcriptase zinc-binding domain-containing protein n=1 Tax=Linum trigynum TaxID=586398 RepID=A0AAV2G8K7_9ROSI